MAQPTDNCSGKYNLPLRAGERRGGTGEVLAVVVVRCVVDAFGDPAGRVGGGQCVAAERAWLLGQIGATR